MAKTEPKGLNVPDFEPAVTDEARENQLISLAINLAEQQLRDGTASAQVITHFLKLGSTKEKLEKQMLKEQTVLVKAKAEAVNDAKNLGEMYENAMAAMMTYKTSSKDEM